MRLVSSSIKAMTFATTVAAAALPKPPPRFIYRLGNSIYVPMTSRSNSRTLPQLRGEGFVLPVSVVAALYRVRQVEQGSGGTAEEDENGIVKDYQQVFGMLQQDETAKIKLTLPPFEPVASLPQMETGRQRLPTLEDLFQEVKHECANRDEGGAPISSIVISGEGEPTLRLDDTMELIRKIKSFTATIESSSEPAPSIRLTTNGLVDDSSLPQQLWDSGVSHISVGLMTWNTQQYEELVQPCHHPQNEALPGLERVCNFAQAATRVNGELVVETTAVDRPDVDKAKTEALSASLGVENPVRWRPYFS